MVGITLAAQRTCTITVMPSPNVSSKAMSPVNGNSERKLTIIDYISS